jgi:hypothetical protein
MMLFHIYNFFPRRERGFTVIDAFNGHARKRYGSTAAAAAAAKIQRDGEITRCRPW